MMRHLRALPKVHLHLHLDGSFPVPAVAEMALRNRAIIPDDRRWTTVWEFFDAYLAVPAAVRSHADLAGLCRALVAHEAAEGVVYAEPGVEPGLYPHLGDEKDVLATVTGAFGEASAATGIEVGAMVVVNTDTGAARAADAAALAASFAGRGVTAFGLACFDEPEDWRPFGAAVRTARRAGLTIACHAGQTGGAVSVRRCVEDLAPDRVAHGVRAAEDADLLDELAARGLVLDVCPTSNVRLGVYGTYADHSLPQLVAAGVAVSVNADDEYWFGSSVSAEFEVCRRHFGFDDPTLAAVALSGAHATAMTDRGRARLRDGVAAWLAGPDLGAAPGAVPEVQLQSHDR